MSAPVYNPGQPYLHVIPGGFSSGKIAHVSGSFTPNSSSIVIKLQTGPNGDPSDEVGLCLFGRHHESILGCNSFLRNMGWGQEEPKQTNFLLTGAQFEITIMCDPTHFKIAVNQAHFTEFNHRIDPLQLNHLSIVSGPIDIMLGCVWIEVPGGINQSNPSFSSVPQGVPHGAPSMPQYGPTQPVPQYGNSNDHHSHKNKGLIGMVSSAGAAVAGALGASHLLGSKNKSHGYAGPGYGGYPSNSSHGYGNSSHGYGHSNFMGGNLANKAMALGGGVVAAKAAKKGFGGAGKMLKYGVPLAGAGLGGYALSRAFSNSFDFDDCDFDGGGCDDFSGCDSD